MPVRRKDLLVVCSVELSIILFYFSSQVSKINILGKLLGLLVVGSFSIRPKLGHCIAIPTFVFFVLLSRRFWRFYSLHGDVSRKRQLLSNYCPFLFHIIFLHFYTRVYDFVLSLTSSEVK